MATTDSNPFNPDSVVANAEKYIGTGNYNHMCEKFAENSYGMGGDFPSAKAAYQYALGSKTLQYGSNAPAGALVFFKGNAQFGHVAISDGKGNVISSGIDGKVQRIGTSDLRKKWGSEGTNLGWTMPTHSFFKNGSKSRMEQLTSSGTPTSTGKNSSSNRGQIFGKSSIAASAGSAMPTPSVSLSGSAGSASSGNTVGGTPVLNVKQGLK